MPKRLILMRHAKSAWDKAETADFDRALSGRGSRSAPTVGAYLARKKLVPQLVLCSSAKRATETWELVATALPSGIPVKHSKALYMAMPNEMLKRIQKVPDEFECVLLVGHNPGVADLAGWLCAEGDAAKRADLARKYPTASIAIIDFEAATWGAVESDSGRLVDFVRPKDIVQP